jgi:hypothetical protein
MTAHIANETCPTCLDLHNLYERNAASLRDARKLCLAALRTADLSPLSTLEEELKQSAAARKIIGHAIRQHQAKQHARVPQFPLAA